ncbi:class I SAM-dependent methyltransferase [Aquella oligotrophica]|uniref:Methyltransferase type 11 domain-containing protein n=1 Tax=Aquella oligotrophica TaxID=2067065 RepID=A0A2I7N9I4_9NEIS|nr:class I SAM-dependent methyltransferase [Aquella oligotrophica]AUR53130.1 hypothetical protein CUN60_00005 [Aquella oligotrophica]
MFNIKFLHEIRDWEIKQIIELFPPNAKILEIGGGSGFQAKQLSDLGFEVISIDLPSSNYASERVFPVIEYDGNSFPFESESFDVVFSSNVLEHIHDLEPIYNESKRVLKPDGYAIHIMPSGSWRFWTIIANYIEYFQRIVKSLLKLLVNILRNICHSIKNFFIEIIKLTISYSIPSSHGGKNNAFFEIWTFSKRAWVNHFGRRQLRLESAKPMGLFYTGHMIFGKYLSITKRSRWAKLLGSACIVYKISNSDKK